MSPTDLQDPAARQLGDRDGTVEEAPAVARAPMSVKEMFTEIEGDTADGGHDEAEDTEVQTVSIALGGHHANGELDVYILQEELFKISGAKRQLKVMRTLQSLIGRQALRIALFPTVRELIDEMHGEPENTLYNLFDPEVIQAMEYLAVKNTIGGLTKEIFEALIKALPRRIQKKALLLIMATRMANEDYFRLTS